MFKTSFWYSKYLLVLSSPRSLNYRETISGGICHGSHRSCWNLPGYPGQRRCIAGRRKAKHKQTSGWGVIFRKNLQTLQVCLYLLFVSWRFFKFKLCCCTDALVHKFYVQKKMTITLIESITLHLSFIDLCLQLIIIETVFDRVLSILFCKECLENECWFISIILILKDHYQFSSYFFSDMACSVAGITSDANVLTNELRLIAQR